MSQRYYKIRAICAKCLDDDQYFFIRREIKFKDWRKTAKCYSCGRTNTLEIMPMPEKYRLRG